MVASGDSSHDGNVLENQCMPCIAGPTTQCFIFLSKLQPRSWIIVRNFVQMKMHLWSKFKVSSKLHRAVSSFAIKLAHQGAILMWAILAFTFYIFIYIIIKSGIIICIYLLLLEWHNHNSTKAPSQDVPPVRWLCRGLPAWAEKSLEIQKPVEKAKQDFLFFWEQIIFVIFIFLIIFVSMFRYVSN